VNDFYETNGWNVDYYKYDGGYFIRQSDKWVEYSPHNTFTFQETGRDDWTAYLYDSGRGVRLFLDIWKGTVFYQENGKDSFALYYMTDRLTGKGVKGSNVDAVSVDNGKTLLAIVNGKWVDGSNSNSYQEIYRNANVVYLRGGSDSIILDISKMEIQNMDGNLRQKISHAYQR
jgi:hypothetical protein